MMINYQGLSKLKTKPIVFEHIIPASDSSTLEQLKELSSKRKAIEDSINNSSSITEAIAREMSRGLTTRCEQDIHRLENYLPLLENFIHHINFMAQTHQVTNWLIELKIRWSSVLSSSSLFRPKFYQFNHMCFEYGMSLFLYGALLRERAFQLLSSDLVQSATLYRKASGVYDYADQKILSKIHWVQESPVECLPRVSTVMSLVCLAEAQAVTARKAQENGNTGGLLAKLHCGVRDFLVEAINVLQETTKEYKNISSHFMDFLLSCKTLHELMGYKYQVEGLTAEGKFGVAIGILRWALANAKKRTPKMESWRSVYQQVIDELTRLLQKYEHENEFIWHEKIPCNDELPLCLPQTPRFVKTIPYDPQKWERKLMFKM